MFIEYAFSQEHISLHGYLQHLQLVENTQNTQRQQQKPNHNHGVKHNLLIMHTGTACV